ncbi:hypothetical protein LINPERHAP2_LOCUS39514, partial [Linum perenne]
MNELDFKFLIYHGAEFSLPGTVLDFVKHVELCLVGLLKWAENDELSLRLVLIKKSTVISLLIILLSGGS